MSKTHIASDGEMVDLLAFEYYGTEAGNIAIWEANPGLADQEQLNAGQEIIIPDWSPPAKPAPIGGVRGQ
ncbi:MAG: tail protein X [Cohaesibacteraceae bacterium]|nr:tail protein X [Cohaesibacteraceae bacterium]MBL4876718.1 tail protein X [Cohaesibacteraceae bacterium]